MKAQLFILGGRDVGRSFDIGAKAVLGRAPECDVRLRDRSISRRHAVVRATDDGWMVEDLGSRNGVRFGGSRVPEARLRDHDEFDLGDLPIRFRLPEAAGGGGAAPTPVPVAEPAAPAELELDDEIELEEEIQLEEEVELEVSPDTVATAEPPRARAPVRLEPAPEDEELELSDYERRRAQILSEGKRTGFLRGDLSQRPFWVKLLVGLFVTALGLGMTGLVFWLMQKVRGSL